MLKNLTARKVSPHNLVPGTEYIGIPKESLPKFMENAKPFKGKFRRYRRVSGYSYLNGKSNVGTPNNDRMMLFDDVVAEDSEGHLHPKYLHLSVEKNEGLQQYYTLYTVKKVRTNEEEKQLKNLAKTRKNQLLGELKSIPNFGVNYLSAKNNAISRGYANTRKNKTRKSRR